MHINKSRCITWYFLMHLSTAPLYTLINRIGHKWGNPPVESPYLYLQKQCLDVFKKKTLILLHEREECKISERTACNRLCSESDSLQGCTKCGPGSGAICCPGLNFLWAFNCNSKILHICLCTPRFFFMLILFTYKLKYFKNGQCNVVQNVFIFL